MPPLFALIYGVNSLMNEDGGRKYLLKMKTIFKPYIKQDPGMIKKKTYQKGQ